MQHHITGNPERRRQMQVW